MPQGNNLACENVNYLLVFTKFTRTRNRAPDGVEFDRRGGPRTGRKSGRKPLRDAVRGAGGYACRALVPTRCGGAGGGPDGLSGCTGERANERVNVGRPLFRPVSGVFVRDIPVSDRLVDLESGFSICASPTLGVPGPVVPGGCWRHCLSLRPFSSMPWRLPSIACAETCSAQRIARSFSQASASSSGMQ